MYNITNQGHRIYYTLTN